MTFESSRSDIELFERRPHYLERDRKIEHVVAKFRYNARRGTLTRAVLTLIAEAAREMADHGTFGFARGAIPYAELQQRFSR